MDGFYLIVFAGFMYFLLIGLPSMLERKRLEAS